MTEFAKTNWCGDVLVNREFIVLLVASGTLYIHFIIWTYKTIVDEYVVMSAGTCQLSPTDI